MTVAKQVEDKLRAQTHRLDALNRIAKTLSSDLNLERIVQNVTDSARELSGAKFGAFFYNLTDEKGERHQLYTLSVAPREAFEKFGLPRHTAVFAPTFSGAEIVRSDDIRSDPRYGKNSPHHGMPDGHLPVASYLAVPVVSRSGEVHGGLFFGHDEPGVFSSEAEQIVVGIAAHAAVALDSARLLQTARMEIQQRTQAEERLLLADRQKDEFLAMLAHELRNPLAPIGNASEILSRTLAEDARARVAVDIIKRQAAQLTRLVDDLLDLARITQGRIQLQRRPIDLASILTHAIETVEPQLRTKRQRLSTFVASYEPLYVNGDHARLVQCLANILANAIKYTDEGGEIRIQSRGDGESAVVEVTDSGVGIAPELLPSIIDNYEQSERTLHRAQGGLGIGLSVVKRLVAMHGGQVAARSAGLGCGSTFELRLPRIARPGTSAVEATSTKGSPRRVLIVDDNQDAANSLALLLGLQGHETQIAYSGKQALEQIELFQPHVALLDLGLPQMDGYELAGRLRTMPQLTGIRLVALTGYCQAEDRHRTRTAGFDDHLVKPAPVSDILSHLGIEIPPNPV
jgi:signal transduction histidine kinase/ActR/RegA family two-component response regulator